MATQPIEPDEPIAEAPQKPATRRNDYWLIIGVALVLVPLVSALLTDLVLIPRAREALSAEESEHVESGAKQKARAGGHGEAARPGDAYSHEFNGIIVNVAGTMGTRYLKISFQTVSSNANLSDDLDRYRAAVLDGILPILSARTLAELEEPDARKTLRNALLETINDIVGQPMVEELYFTEFVVQ